MFAIKPYGLVIALAITVGYLVGFWRRQKYEIKSSDLENLFLLVVPLGIVGARLYHVLDKWSYYNQHFFEIFAVWNGGLGIYGAVAGGIVGLAIYTKMYNEQFTIYNLLDFFMPPLAIGQAIGRWGNFANHEVFGGPTNLPWGWFIPENLRPEIWINYSYFHPTFAYESLWVLLGFIILLFLEVSLRGAKRRDNLSFLAGPASARLARGYFGKQKTRTRLALSPAPGLLTGFYAIWYGVGRFFFEFLRFDTAEVGGIKVAQIISLCLVVGGGWLVRKSLSPNQKSLV